jgi:hypothetical protein
MWLETLLLHADSCLLLRLMAFVSLSLPLRSLCTSLHCNLTGAHQGTSATNMTVKCGVHECASTYNANI